MIPPVAIAQRTAGTCLVSPEPSAEVPAARREELRRRQVAAKLLC